MKLFVPNPLYHGYAFPYASEEPKVQKFHCTKDTQTGKKKYIHFF